jgi:hypothetical protein
MKRVRVRSGASCGEAERERPCGEKVASEVMVRRSSAWDGDVSGRAQRVEGARGARSQVESRQVASAAALGGERRAMARLASRPMRSSGVGSAAGGESQAAREQVSRAVRVAAGSVYMVDVLGHGR